MPFFSGRCDRKFALSETNGGWFLNDFENPCLWIHNLHDWEEQPVVLLFSYDSIRPYVQVNFLRLCWLFLKMVSHFLLLTFDLVARFRLICIMPLISQKLIVDMLSRLKKQASWKHLQQNNLHFSFYYKTASFKCNRVIGNFLKTQSLAPNTTSKKLLKFHT